MNNKALAPVVSMTRLPISIWPQCTGSKVPPNIATLPVRLWRSLRTGSRFNGASEAGVILVSIDRSLTFREFCAGLALDNLRDYDGISAAISLV